MRGRPLLLSLIGLLVSGCATALQDIGREPSLTPVGSGLVPDRMARLDVPATIERPRSRNTAWSDTASDLFRDSRAVQAGDVVTVKVQIKDKASLDNTLNRSRDSKAGVNTSLGYSVDAGPAVASGTGKLDGNLGRTTSTDSKGAIARSESIDLLVAAVVSDVLPNGNLVISGTQEVRVNFEVRVLSVAGVIRPRDIAADNTISYDKIAEARVSYGGRGRVTEIQQPAYGHQILDLMAPF
jgi:flagellar L-ring protein FlgH